MLNIKKTRTTPYHPQSDGMVDRFHRTLVRMLKTYINEHQSDWDDYLPYVTMAYRSVKYETTGCSPNSFMLGREVQTHLDIMYEMLASIKSIPAIRWASESKEKMEAAHRIARGNIAGTLLRQKSLHDRNVSKEKFNKEDEVYIFFPRHIPGLSSKFTNYWRGPFRVVEKNTDVTHDILCWRKGRPQTIHVDRMKGRRSQHLQFETCAGEPNVSPPSRNDEMVIDMVDTEYQRLTQNVRDESLALSSRRTRRPPEWMSDHIAKF